LSEEIVGEALKGRREEVILATKCGMVWDKEKGDFFFHCNEKGITKEPSQLKVYKYLGPESIRAEAEASLRRLGTDYIDLYQTHWQESTTPIEDSMGELLKLKEEGKIRAIGVSNVNGEQLKKYLACGEIVSAQERYTMIDRHIEEEGLLGYCREQGLAVLAYSPLEGGLLTGKITADYEFEEGDLRSLNPLYSVKNRRKMQSMLDEMMPIAQRHGVNITQLVIGWTFAQPGLTHVLCGARNKEQAAANAKAGDIKLSSEEIERIIEIVSQYSFNEKG
jgi:aryl-alcohol dehydrogenase-like predicted oxidoreductase